MTTSELGACRAAVPVAAPGSVLAAAGMGGVVIPSWRECGRPAAAEYEYRCPAGHTKRRATCPEHEPAPGDVGCRDCFDAGTERPMTFTRVA